MDFRIAAYDPRTGDFLRMMPRPVSVQIGDTFGTRGTLELTYAGGVQIETFLEVQEQVSFGGDWEPVGPALLRLGGSHEDTDASGMRTIQFVSREWVLGKARVGEGDLELIDGKRPFYQASPGEIMRTLLLEAQDRGAAAGIEVGDFNASRDSAGNAWPKVATIYYGPGLPIGSVLENLVEQGMCDYRMNGRTLELYAPETTLGRDQTTGSDPVRIHGSVTEAPVTYTLEDLTTSALLIGEEGFELEVANPSAPRDYGELEVTIEQGGVNSEGTARTMIDAELQRGSREIREITRSQNAANVKHLPYRDYRVGDYVQAYDNGRWERYRVREIQLVKDGDGWAIHTVLNDRLQELLLKLAKRTNGIVNGTKGSGGDGTPPAPAPKPGIEPAAPEGLVIDQQVYLDGNGNARGLVTAGWGAVTESVRERAIDIGGYELWRRDNDTYAPWRIVASTDGATETTDSPVWLTRGDGSAAEYQWRVRAIAEASGREGEWSRPVTMTMTQDTTPPPPPSDPVVSTGFRIVTVEWDGLTEDGTDMPSDFSRVRIYLADTENMDEARLAGSLSYPGSWNSETMPADVPVWVTMTAVDRVGNESDPTPAVDITPRALVSDEDIQDALDKVEGDIDAVRGSRTYKATPPNVDGANVDDVWYQIVDGSTVGWWRWDGDSWVEQGLDATFLPLVDIGTGTFGELDGVRLKAGSVVADTVIVPGSVGGTLIEDGAVKTFHLAANSVEADQIAGGAIDGKIITGATVRTNSTGARVVLNASGFYAYNSSGGQTVGINAQTGAVNLTANVTQTNSYGSARFGPQIYDGSSVTPALGFSVPGYDWWGNGGVYARDDGSAGFPEMRLQGFVNGPTDGSSITLAPGGTSTESVTSIRRQYTSGQVAALQFHANRNLHLDTGGGDLLVRARNSANTDNNSYLALRKNGTVSLAAANDRSFFVNTSGTIAMQGGNGANRSVIWINSDSDVRGDAPGGDVVFRSRSSADSSTNSSVSIGRNGVLRLASTADGASAEIRSTNYFGIWAKDFAWSRAQTGSGTNVVMSGTRLYRASSSEKYKLLLEDANYGCGDLEDKLLSVSARSWYENGDAERFAEYLDGDETDYMATPRRRFGATAEEVDALGLEGLVIYGEDGEPDGLMYDRFGVLLIPVVKRLRDRVDELETLIGEMNA